MFSISFIKESGLYTNFCFWSVWVSILFCTTIKAQPYEVMVLKKINAPDLKLTGRVLTLSSESVTPFAIGVSAGIITAGLVTHQHRTLDNGIQVGSSLIFASLSSTALKYSMRRKRPADQYDFIRPRVSANDPSFPSGHTTVAFALATAVCILQPNWYVIAPAGLWAGSVAYSRMYLGVHFPSDILGGMVIGTGISFLVWQGRKWIEKK